MILEAPSSTNSHLKPQPGPPGSCLTALVLLSRIMSNGTYAECCHHHPLAATTDCELYGSHTGATCCQGYPLLYWPPGHRHLQY